MCRFLRSFFKGIGATLCLTLASTSVSAGQRAQIGPAANAEDIPQLATLLERTGWAATPELSSVFKAGSVFSSEGGQHRLMSDSCFDAPVTVNHYTSVEMLRDLQGGVAVNAGFGRVRAKGSLVRHLKFGTPEHQSMAAFEIKPTSSCAAKLAQIPVGQRHHLYVVQEVLTAKIKEQTCGRLNANGRFVGLGQAEAELAAACTQVSTEPVAVGYRVVPLTELVIPALEGPSANAGPGDGCEFGKVETITTTRHSMTINGETLNLRGKEAHTEVMTQLQQCGYWEASRAFDIWRQKQRATSIAAATLVGMYPLGIGIVTAKQAARWRQRTADLLVNPAIAEGSEKWKADVRSPD